MTYPSDSASLSDEARGDRPMPHGGIGITQWLALGLVVFSLLAVILAVVINFILGSHGG